MTPTQNHALRDQLAELLHSIGWRDTCDAQWQQLHDAMPAIAALLSAQAAPALPDEFKLPLPQPLRSIGSKWIEYAQDQCDPNDIAFAIWSAIHEAAQPKQEAAAERDWPEDFAHENGNYLCNCISCGAVFIGYKRRITCKVCANQSQGSDQ